MWILQIRTFSKIFLSEMTLKTFKTYDDLILTMKNDDLILIMKNDDLILMTKKLFLRSLKISLKTSSMYIYTVTCMFWDKVFWYFPLHLAQLEKNFFIMKWSLLNIKIYKKNFWFKHKTILPVHLLLKVKKC